MADLMGVAEDGAATARTLFKSELQVWAPRGLHQELQPWLHRLSCTTKPCAQLHGAPHPLPPWETVAELERPPSRTHRCSCWLRSFILPFLPHPHSCGGPRALAGAHQRGWVGGRCRTRCRPCGAVRGCGQAACAGGRLMRFMDWCCCPHGAALLCMVQHCCAWCCTRMYLSGTCRCVA